MNKNKILNILDHLEKTITELRSEVGVSEEVAAQVKENHSSPKREKSVDLNGPVKTLYDCGFFKDGRIDLDVAKELQMKLLTSKKPLRPSIVNVLRKMVANGTLIRDYITKDKKSILIYKNATK